MATIERLDEPGRVHHVIHTSVAEAAVFAEPGDREWYITRLSRVSREEGAVVLAFALMDTHAHLLLLVLGSALRRVMARLGTGFAKQYNRRNGRRGRVFGETYWSRAILSELQLRRTVRYIVLNPLTARMVPSLGALEQSDRTSLPALLGLRPARLEDTRRVWRHFGADPRSAIDELRRWIALGNEGFDPEGLVETDGDSLLNMDAAAALRTTIDRETTREQIRRSGWTLELVMEWGCAALGVSPAEVHSGSRRASVSAARAVIAHLSVTILGFTIVETAERLAIGPGAVSNALTRGARIAHARGLRLDPMEPPRVR